MDKKLNANARRKLLEKAQGLSSKGKYSKAADTYLKLVSADRADANIRVKLADTYVKDKNNTEAVKYLKEAASIYTKNGFFQKSIAVYKRIAAMGFDSEDIQFNIAELMVKLGLIADGLQVYDRLIHNGSNESKAKALEAAASLPSDNYKYKYMFGTYLYNKGKKANGESLVASALEQAANKRGIDKSLEIASKFLKDVGRGFIVVRKMVDLLAAEKDRRVSEWAQLAITLTPDKIEKEILKGYITTDKQKKVIAKTEDDSEEIISLESADISISDEIRIAISKVNSLLSEDLISQVPEAISPLIEALSK